MRMMSHRQDDDDAAERFAMTAAACNQHLIRLIPAVDSLAASYAAYAAAVERERKVADDVEDLGSFLAALVFEARTAVSSHRVFPATLSNLGLLPRTVRGKAEEGEAAKRRVQEALPSLRTAWASAKEMHAGLDVEMARAMAAMDEGDRDELRRKYTASLVESGEALERCMPPPIGGGTDGHATLLLLPADVESLLAEAEALSEELQAGASDGTIALRPQTQPSVVTPASTKTVVTPRPLVRKSGGRPSTSVQSSGGRNVGGSASRAQLRGTQDLPRRENAPWARGFGEVLAPDVSVGEVHIRSEAKADGEGEHVVETTSSTSIAPLQSPPQPLMAVDEPFEPPLSTSPPPPPSHLPSPAPSETPAPPIPPPPPPRSPRPPRPAPPPPHPQPSAEHATPTDQSPPRSAEPSPRQVVERAASSPPKPLEPPWSPVTGRAPVRPHDDSSRFEASQATPERLTNAREQFAAASRRKAAQRLQSAARAKVARAQLLASVEAATKVARAWRSARDHRNVEAEVHAILSWETARAADAAADRVAEQAAAEIRVQEASARTLQAMARRRHAIRTRHVLAEQQGNVSRKAWQTRLSHQKSQAERRRHWEQQRTQQRQRQETPLHVLAAAALAAASPAARAAAAAAVTSATRRNSLSEAGLYHAPVVKQQSATPPSASASTQRSYAWPRKRPVARSPRTCLASPPPSSVSPAPSLCERRAAIRAEVAERHYALSAGITSRLGGEAAATQAKRERLEAVLTQRATFARASVPMGARRRTADRSIDTDSGGVAGDADSELVTLTAGRPQRLAPTSSPLLPNSSTPTPARSDDASNQLAWFGMEPDPDVQAPSRVLSAAAAATSRSETWHPACSPLAATSRVKATRPWRLARGGGADEGGTAVASAARPSEPRSGIRSRLQHKPALPTAALQPKAPGERKRTC